MYFFHSIIMRIGLIMAKCGAFLACIKKYTQQLYLSHVLTSYLHCFSCSDSHVPPRSQGAGTDRRCGRDRMPRLCSRRGILLCRRQPLRRFSNSALKSGITAVLGLFLGKILQRFPSLTPEITNHCTQEVVNGHNLAAIAKFDP